MSRTIVAERILKAAAEGERDPERLLEAALIDSRSQIQAEVSKASSSESRPTV